MFRRFLSRPRAFRADRRGASAVEFALVSIPFFAVIFAIFESMIVVYYQDVFDYGVQKAVNQYRSSVVSADWPDSTTFINTYLCPNLPSSVDCSKIVASAYPGGNACGAYLTSVNSATSATTCYSQFVSYNKPRVISLTTNNGWWFPDAGAYLTVIYPMPLMFTIWDPNGTANLNGQNVRVIRAAAIIGEDVTVCPVVGC